MPEIGDKGNVGDSLIIAFGEYTGGQLAVEDGTVLVHECRVQQPALQPAFRGHDLNRRFYRFNGSRQMHWVLPFEGERYTAVFYTHRDA